MKEVIGITTNHLMAPKHGKDFKLEPMMELIITHSDGKTYSHDGKKLSSITKFSETRLFISVSGMKELMNKMSIAMSSLMVLENNCDQINQLIDVAKGKGQLNEK